MTRPARQISPSGLYHIMFRGMSRCHIFEESEDFEKLLALISLTKAELQYKLLGFCLLDNHAHLIIQEENPGDITMAMRKVLGPYANWFNRKYFRSGALLANRYRSECIIDERYLFALIRYVHQNPLVAGIAKELKEYKWSSYKEYVSQQEVYADISYVLDLFSPDRKAAVETFIEFHKVDTNFSHSLMDKPKKTKNDIQHEIQSILNGKELCDLGGLPRQERNDILVMMKKHGLSIRQIERMTGISRGIVARA